MQTFYAGELKQLTELLQGLNGLLVKYNRKDPDLLPLLIHWLDASILQYKNLGQAEKESRFNSLKAELVTAQRGIHPLTFEKITLRRHEFQLTIAWKILQTAEVELRGDLQAIKEVLKEVAQLLSQIIVAGFQSNLLTKEKIKEAETQSQLKALWQSLSADANIALGQTRVLLMVSEFDVLILLGDLFARLK